MTGRDRRRNRSADPADPAAPRREPVPLAQLLEAFGARRGWERRLEGARIHERWDEIAGPQLARHAQPVRLHGGVLVVRVDHPTWASEVRYLATELAARANTVLGEGQVTRVAVVSGPGESGDRRGRSGR